MGKRNLFFLFFLPWTSCEFGRNERIGWSPTVTGSGCERWQLNYWQWVGCFGRWKLYTWKWAEDFCTMRKSDVKTFSLHWRAFIYGGIWSRERKRLDGRLILRSMIVTQKMFIQVVAVQEENIISWWQLGQCLYDSSYLARFCPWQPNCIYSTEFSNWKRIGAHTLIFQDHLSLFVYFWPSFLATGAATEHASCVLKTAGCAYNTVTNLV